MSQEHKGSLINQPGRVVFDNTGAAIETGTGKPAVVCQDGQVRTAEDPRGHTNEFLDAYASITLTAQTAP